MDLYACRTGRGGRILYTAGMTNVQIPTKATALRQSAREETASLAERGRSGWPGTGATRRWGGSPWLALLIEPQNVRIGNGLDIQSPAAVGGCQRKGCASYTSRIPPVGARWRERGKIEASSNMTRRRMRFVDSHRRFGPLRQRAGQSRYAARRVAAAPMPEAPMPYLTTGLTRTT